MGTFCIPANVFSYSQSLSVSYVARIDLIVVDRIPYTYVGMPCFKVTDMVCVMAGLRSFGVQQKSTTWQISSVKGQSLVTRAWLGLCLLSLPLPGLSSSQRCFWFTFESTENVVALLGVKNPFSHCRTVTPRARHQAHYNMHH